MTYEPCSKEQQTSLYVLAIFSFQKVLSLQACFVWYPNPSRPGHNQYFVFIHFHTWQTCVGALIWLVTCVENMPGCTDPIHTTPTHTHAHTRTHTSLQRLRGWNIHTPCYMQRCLSMCANTQRQECRVGSGIHTPPPTHTHVTIQFSYACRKKTRHGKPPAVNYTFILFVFSSVCWTCSIDVLFVYFFTFQTYFKSNALSALSLCLVSINKAVLNMRIQTGMEGHRTTWGSLRVTAWFLPLKIYSVYIPFIMLLFLAVKCIYSCTAIKKELVV